MRLKLFGRHGAFLGAVFGALLPLCAQPAAAVEDLDSDCPVFQGQSHAQILHGVEGRLNGDWQLAIRTTERSAKRIKEKGEDPSQAELFIVVLKCLRDEVAAGRHADAVARAKADPRALQQSQSSQSTQSTPPTQPAQSMQAPTQVVEEKVVEETVVEQAVVEETVVETADTTVASEAPPPPAPAPVVTQSEFPATNSGSGTALPGTAESYGSAGGSDQQAALSAQNGDQDYTGQACTYFTRPFQEVVDGVQHVNRYLEGEWVCHGGTMYACIGGVWNNKGACQKYSRWETRLSETLEAQPR